MFKKAILPLASLLCMLCLLSGCFQRIIPETPTQAPTQVYTEPSIETTQPTETQPPEPANPLELPDLPIQAAYNPQGQYEACFDSNLYHIAPLDSTEFYSDVAACGDMLAAVRFTFVEGEDEYGGSTHITILLYNMRTKQIVAEIDTAEDQRSIGFLPDGKLYTGSSFDSTVYVYDTDGSLIEKYTGFDGSYQVVGDSKGRLWCFSGWTLHCLYEGTDTAFEIEPCGFLPSVCEVRGNMVYYSRTSAFTEVCRYDAVTGENTLCEELMDFWSRNSRMYRFSNIDIGVLNKEGHEVCFPWTGESYDTQAVPGGDYLYAGHTSDDHTVTKFSPETKSSVSVDLGEKSMGTIGAGNNCGIFTSLANESTYEVYYWADLPENWQEEPEATVITLSEQETQNVATAQRLSQEYGLHIHGLPIREGSNISGYIATAYDGINWEADYLIALETELERYPKGFFNALKNEYITTIELLYSGGLESDGSENTISTAGAVTNISSNTIYITFNVGSGGSLTTNMPHELFHVMENSAGAIQPLDEITDEFDKSNSSLFPGWDALNPEGFSYFDDYGAYEAADSNADYLTYTEDDEDNVYFIDIYSKTYAKEDRARIFENMMTDYDPAYFSTYPHIKAKAEYLCSWIEENFPAMYENGTPLWVENLEKYS